MTTIQFIMFGIISFVASIEVEKWAKTKTPNSLGSMVFYFLLLLGTIVDAILSKV